MENILECNDFLATQELFIYTVATFAFLVHEALYNYADIHTRLDSYL